jgi:hypothetical protein
MSYANVMSTIAVVLALGGGAYAASKTTSKQIKNNTIKSVDQKDRKAVQGVDVVPDSITGGEILESSLAQVPSAAAANNAVTADHADTADDAEDADSASSANNGATGWARIADDGFVQSGHFIFQGNVTRQSEGIYCFDDLDGFPDTGFVTGDVSQDNDAQDNFFSVSMTGDSPACPGNEDAVVESRDEDGGDPTGAAVLQDADFFVVFF